MPAASIGKIHWKQESNGQGGYRLTGSVVETSNISPNIFLYQRSANGEDEYYSVCSLDNMLNVQSDSPPEGSTYCRKSTMVLEYETAKEMLDDKDDIDDTIEKLIEDYNLYLNSLIREYDQAYS